MTCSKLLLAIVLCMLQLGTAGTALAQGRTNVLIIMLDDLDQSLYETALANKLLPNIERDIISVGTTFRQSFVTTPLCCPSRSTYLTGQYAHNHGVFRNTGPHGGFDHFPDGSTLATWLNDAGYRTGHVGKYLNDYLDARYVPPGWQTWRATVRATNCMYDYTISEDGVARAYGSAAADYQTDVLARYADQFLRVRDNRPFFLNVAVSAPHNESCLRGEPGSQNGRIRPAPRHQDTPPVALPAAARSSFNEADLSDKPAWMQLLLPVDLQSETRLFNQKLASLRAVDDLVGRLNDTLRETRKGANTAVILVSDNGYFYGTHRLREKTFVYEESVRVPLVIHHPGQAAARVVDEWVLNTDWAPTIVQYARATAGLAMDGRSLVPLVRGEIVDAWRNNFLIEHVFDGTDIVRPQPYTAVRSKDPQLFVGASGGTLVYCETFDSISNNLLDIELYDLQRDALQLRSLHNSSDPQRVLQMRALKAQLRQLKTCGNGSCQILEQAM